MQRSYQRKHFAELDEQREGFVFLGQSKLVMDQMQQLLRIAPESFGERYSLVTRGGRVDVVLPFAEMVNVGRVVKWKKGISASLWKKGLEDGFYMLSDYLEDCAELHTDISSEAGDDRDSEDRDSEGEAEEGSDSDSESLEGESKVSEISSGHGVRRSAAKEIDEDMRWVHVFGLPAAPLCSIAQTPENLIFPLSSTQAMTFPVSLPP